MKTQAWKILKPELFWWFLLASTVSMLLAVMGVVMAMCHYSSPLGDKVLVGVWALAEILLLSACVKKLKTRYLATNERWNARLQFSLSDLLSVMFFFGCVMLFLRSCYPSEFIGLGVILNTGYFLSLIFSIRQGGFSPDLATWLIACLRLGVAIIFLICGFFIQVLALMILIRIIYGVRIV